jgi:hypothetical protein
LLGLKDVALSVVGSERNPWLRAQRLVEWFGREFRYTLNVPTIEDRDRAVLLFVTQTRRGHCEYFASAMALMLRTLGHPTRLAFGFRGGDFLEERGVVIVRGAHAHMWPEMYFQGVGWVPLEPTPPDRSAEDAETFTRAAAEGRGSQDPPLAERLLRYGAEDRRRLWGDAASAVAGAVRDGARTAFGPSGGYAGYALVALCALLLLRRRVTTGRAREALGAGRRLPQGPYGDALVLLSRRGARRRAGATAREFLRSVGERWPGGRAAFERLTAHYERERFGGGTRDADREREAAHALRDLRRELEAEGRPDRRL